MRGDKKIKVKIFKVKFFLWGRGDTPVTPLLKPITLKPVS